MKNRKIDYFLVGIMVLAAGLGLMLALALLSGQTGARDHYYAIYRNVTGVKFGTQVMYEGYPVGQVEKVTPLEVAGGMRFRVDFSVARGWKIPEDSRAQIQAPGLLAAITLAIQAGESPQALEPGAEVAGLEAANIFAAMSAVAGDINELSENAVKPMLANIDRTVTLLGDIIEEDGQLLVAEMLAMVSDIKSRVPVIAGNFESFSRDINQASSQLTTLLSAENSRLIQEMVANLHGASQETRLIMEKANSLVANADGVVEGNRKNIDAAIADLRNATKTVARHAEAINHSLEGAARNMNEFSRQIRQNPALLLSGTPPKDEAADIR